jgi:hypothetical protein
MKKILLPAVGKENTRVISKAVPSLNKGSMGILFRESTHIYSEKHFGDGRAL